MTTVETPVSSRPLRDPLLEFHPAGDGEPFAATVFHPVNEQYVGLGEAPYRLLHLCDGTRTQAELCAEFGLPEGAPEIVRGLTMLQDKRLLVQEGAVESAVQPADGYRVRRRLGPFELVVKSWANPQLSVLHPEAFFARLRPTLVALSSRGPIMLAAVALVSGLVFVATYRRVLLPTIPHGLFSREMLIAGLLVWAFLFLHELSHAAVLARFGGRVRRIGVMLFYGRPVMFVDANDAHVLPSRWQRVAVAAAGPATHLFAGTGLAVVLTVSQLVDPRAAGWERIAFELVVANFVMLVLNLLPFVKLDGYWVLASALGRPHLRADALARASRLIGRRVPKPSWPAGRISSAVLTGFGILSAISSSVLVTTVLVSLRGWLLQYGRLGAAVCLIGVATAAVLLARGAVDALRALHTSGDLRRVLTTVGALALAIVVGLHLVVGVNPISAVLSFAVEAPWASVWP